MKHLNPRQGITTVHHHEQNFRNKERTGVKHLNPRQGITTDHKIVGRVGFDLIQTCETPKSPPGDYNAGWISAATRCILGV